MKSFKSHAYMIFEQEELSSSRTGHLKHLTHAEDEHIHNGMEGAEHSYNMLHSVHKSLTGEGGEDTKTTVKYDGSPSIVFGVHPETGAPFVTTKSGAFSKNAKINYTPRDIMNNYESSEDLQQKLKTALKYLPKILPEEGGIYQGDLMYTKSDVNKEGDKISFKPQLITYSVSKNSPTAKLIEKAKLGLVIHTKYEGNSFEDLKPTDVDLSAFAQSPDVHVIDPTIKNPPFEYSDKLQKEFHGHMAKARKVAHDLTPEDYQSIEGHESNLENHVNDMLKRGDKPSVNGYIKHLERKRDGDTGKALHEGSGGKINRYNKLIDHVRQNAKSFNKVFDFHTHIQNAKNALVKGLGNPTEFEHTIDDKPTSPEGFVSIRNGKMTKLNNREDFNRKNLLAR